MREGVAHRPDVKGRRGSLKVGHLILILTFTFTTCNEDPSRVLVKGTSGVERKEGLVVDLYFEGFRSLLPSRYSTFRGPGDLVVYLPVSTVLGASWYHVLSSF